MAYAVDTNVTVAKTRGEISDLMEKYGIRNHAVGQQDGNIALLFEHAGRRLRFVLPLPTAKDERFTKTGRTRSPSQIQAAVQQKERSAWRTLLFVVRAKFEVVEMGIIEFSDEFMANIVLSNNQTMGEWVASQPEAIDARELPPILPIGNRSIALGPGR